MKKTLQFLSIGLMAFGLIFSQSCKDPCKEVTCENGGTCNEGVCDCPAEYFGDNCQTHCLNGGTGSNSGCSCTTGYEGTDCGTKMTTKFLGNWSDLGTDNCANSTITVGITQHSTAVDKILISNFGKFGCAGNWPTVEATISGTQITIASQTFCPSDQFTVSGSGSINASGNTITLNYSGNNPPSVTGGGTYTCSVTFSK